VFVRQACAKKRGKVLKKKEVYQNVTTGVMIRRPCRLMLAMINFRFSSAGHVALIAAALLIAHQTPTLARTCTAVSGSQRTALLELYTSEGCDSCPSADKWVGELPARNLSMERLIPLAFHVDYWNYIGWTDPFAQARFSERQRQHSRRRGTNFVFTPQLLLNGQDYRRGLLFDDFPGKVKPINQSRPLADIKLTLTSSTATLVSEAEATVKNPALRSAQLFIALYENNLVSAVKSGENKGRTLKHDFVVRELAGPFGLDATGLVQREHLFSLDPSWKSQDLGVVVLLQHPQSGDVLQALAATCR
jgi:hypothetical protein